VNIRISCHYIVELDHGVTTLNHTYMYLFLMKILFLTWSKNMLIFDHDVVELNHAQMYFILVLSLVWLWCVWIARRSGQGIETQCFSDAFFLDAVIISVISVNIRINEQDIVVLNFSLKCLFLTWTLSCWWSVKTCVNGRELVELMLVEMYLFLIWAVHWSSSTNICSDRRDVVALELGLMCFLLMWLLS
jgi:hypothetical protein